MNSYKKLFNNIVVYSFGTLGSKMISFLLVPLYTYYLSQGEYGTTDLVMTTVSMLLPVVSLSMFESVLRYVMNKSVDKSEIMTNALGISTLGYFVFLLIYPILSYFDILEENLIYLYLLLFVEIINTLFAQFARGVGEPKVFAFSGIITTFFTGVLNILFLVIFKWGVAGYFYAYIIAYLISTVYLLIKVKPLKGVRINYFRKDIATGLVGYSVPLIPNSLMWWLINSSSRYFITFFVGIDANGIFAVSSKIPALINMISQTFSQAWKISAFEEYEKGENDQFYSNIFDLYMSVLLFATIIIISIIKPVFSILFAESYNSAWYAVPFLLLGTVFSAASGFLGVAYTASKKTNGVFKTSIYGGVISILMNLIFIPTLGTIGAGISSMFSFFAMFVIRYFDTKKLMKITVNWKKILFTIGLILLQTMFLFFNLNIYTELAFSLIIIICFLIINYKHVNYLWKFTIIVIKRIRKK